MSIEEGSAHIYNALKRAIDKKEGLLIGRNGTIELEVMLFKSFSAAPLQEYPKHLQNKIELHAGVWPPTKNLLDKWVFSMLEAIRLSDVLVAGWYEPLKEAEKKLLDQVNTLSPRIPLRSLEPYYVEPSLRWTNLLKDQRVAVVSSFSSTIPKQVEKRQDIWPMSTESLLPVSTTWIPIPTGYSPALAQGNCEWPKEIQSWDVAVMDCTKRVMKANARIAIIGCGGLGMLIGAELRKRGVIAIVLGGAIQVLFGIKGSRWENHSVISRFWNEAWVWPDPKETPGGAQHIEGACYWKKN
jgi:hypothetical protein